MLLLDVEITHVTLGVRKIVIIGVGERQHHEGARRTGTEREYLQDDARSLRVMKKSCQLPSHHPRATDRDVQHRFVEHHVDDQRVLIGVEPPSAPHPLDEAVGGILVRSRQVFSAKIWSAQNFNRSSELVEVASVPAPPEVTERLGVPEGTSVVRRSYLLSIDGEVAQTARSYFTHELADGTVLAEHTQPANGTHAYLADDLGAALDIAVEELIARMPTPQELMTLRLVPGTPVVELIRAIYDKSQKPVEVTVFLFAADRHSFAYVVPLD